MTGRGKSLLKLSQSRREKWKQYRSRERTGEEDLEGAFDKLEHFIDHQSDDETDDADVALENPYMELLAKAAEDIDRVPTEKQAPKLTQEQRQLFPHYHAWEVAESKRVVQQLMRDLEDSGETIKDLESKNVILKADLDRSKRAFDLNEIIRAKLYSSIEKMFKSSIDIPVSGAANLSFANLIIEFLDAGGVEGILSEAVYFSLRKQLISLASKIQNTQTVHQKAKAPIKTRKRKNPNQWKEYREVDSLDDEEFKKEMSFKISKPEEYEEITQLFVRVDIPFDFKNRPIVSKTPKFYAEDSPELDVFKEGGFIIDDKCNIIARPKQVASRIPFNNPNGEPRRVQFMIQSKAVDPYYPFPNEQKAITKHAKNFASDIAMVTTKLFNNLSLTEKIYYISIACWYYYGRETQSIGFPVLESQITKLLSWMNLPSCPPDSYAKDSIPPCAAFGYPNVGGGFTAKKPCIPFSPEGLTSLDEETKIDVRTSFTPEFHVMPESLALYTVAYVVGDKWLYAGNKQPDRMKSIQDIRSLRYVDQVLIRAQTRRILIDQIKKEFGDSVELPEWRLPEIHLEEIRWLEGACTMDDERELTIRDAELSKEDAEKLFNQLQSKIDSLSDDSLSDDSLLDGDVPESIDASSELMLEEVSNSTFDEISITDQPSTSARSNLETEKNGARGSASDVISNNDQPSTSARSNLETEKNGPSDSVFPKPLLPSTKAKSKSVQIDPEAVALKDKKSLSDQRTSKKPDRFSQSVNQIAGKRQDSQTKQKSSDTQKLVEVAEEKEEEEDEDEDEDENDDGDSDFSPSPDVKKRKRKYEENLGERSNNEVEDRKKNKKT